MLGRSTGFEPATSGTTNRRSNQLSYDRHMPLPAYHHSGCCQARTRRALYAWQTRGQVRLRQGTRLLHKGLRMGSENCFPGALAQDCYADVGGIAKRRRRIILAAMIDATDSITQRLTAHPAMQRVPSPKVEIFQLRRFVPPELCADLIALIERDRRPSTIADDNGDAYFRTSETCDLAAELPAVRQIETMITRLCGIDPAYGEPLQGQRYDVGQEFKPHTDFFAPDGKDFARFCTLSGQRTWTFMIYLNDVAAGGATRFKLIGKTFQPEAGKLLFWNNRLPAAPDGQSAGVNHATLHHGMKVRKGVKYVITKWYREREWRG